MELKKQHFIIVDDDRQMRYLIRRIVERTFPEATIMEAGDGVEALRMFESGGADLMVIDHNMPLLSGADLVRELRARQVSIPLLIASNFPGARAEAQAAGASAFVDKGEINPGLAVQMEKLLAT